MIYTCLGFFSGLKYIKMNHINDPNPRNEKLYSIQWTCDLVWIQEKFLPICKALKNVPMISESNMFYSCFTFLVHIHKTCKPVCDTITIVLDIWFCEKLLFNWARNVNRANIWFIFCGSHSSIFESVKAKSFALMKIFWDC